MRAHRLRAALANASGGGGEDPTPPAWTQSDISTLSMNATSPNLSSTTGATVRGLDVSFDEDVMWVLNNTGTIYQFSMSTASDVTTLSYDSVSFSVSSQCSNAQDFAMAFNGRHFYVIDKVTPPGGGSAPDVVYQYDLSTPYDLLTASYSGNSLNVSSTNSPNNPSGVELDNDGGILYVSYTPNGIVCEYSLSTDFDVSSGSFVSEAILSSSSWDCPTGVRAASDGTSLYGIGNANNGCETADLSPAWDSSSMSSVFERLTNFTKNTSYAAIGGGCFSSNGDKLWLLGYELGFGDNTVVVDEWS